MIPASERAVLEWNNIEYFVPAKKPVNWEQRKARIDQDKKPLLDNTIDLDTVVEQCTEKACHKNISSRKTISIISKFCLVLMDM